MKILVASVYNKNSLKWESLQRGQINLNTNCYFQQKIFFNGETSNSNFIALDIKDLNPAQQHTKGLNSIISFFLDSDFSHCLILDSDAFPIKKNWHSILLKKMLENDCEIAAPIRFENLDTFYHPCVIFLSRSAAEKISFVFKQVTNILEYSFNELTVVSEGRIFPLLKTNKFSPHPIISCIYYDLFYHHGCGSRRFSCRSTHINKYYDFSKSEFKLITRMLFSDPEGFVKKLTHNPNNYRHYMLI